jgi:poly-D-alanine transfer protein DltD
MACSALVLWVISGFGFASQGSADAELKQVLSAQHKTVFANDCQEEDKVDGECQQK